MGKLIAVANQKGGVGKTTSAVNLASCLGSAGKKVLLIDLDPQGNATSGVGVNKRTLKTSSYDLLIGNTKAADTVLQTKFKNLWVIPCNADLAGAEIELVDMADRLFQLRKAVVSLKDSYDFILIDCPPSLSLITLNALSACDTILIPIQCEYYALEGLSQLMNTVRQVKKRYNPTLEVEGVLVTMLDGRLNLTGQVLSEVKKYFGSKVFKTAIPRTVRLSEAPSHGKPINYYDPASTGSKAYLALAAELIEKQ